MFSIWDKPHLFEQMQYFGLSFSATLVPIRAEEAVVKTYLNAKRGRRVFVGRDKPLHAFVWQMQT